MDTLTAWGVRQLCPTRLYTFSDDGFLKVHDVDAPSGSFVLRPVGLWYSPGGEYSWFDWCVDNDCIRFLRPYLYALELDYSNVLRLTSAEDLLEFTHTFGTHELGWDFVRQIDWARVHREFDAIEINPYVLECRLEPITHWYYPWDCASGCVWRSSVVKSVKLIGKKKRNYDESEHESFREIGCCGSK